MGNEYKVADLPKSGFNLTYNSHVGGLALGRLYPVGYHHIHSGDKFSGRNDYSLKAEPIATPVVSDVNVSLHNFFVTYRSIHKGFEDLLTPTKLNGMSASLSAPSFRLSNIVRDLLSVFAYYLPTINTANSVYQNSPYVQKFISSASFMPVYDATYASGNFTPDSFAITLQTYSVLARDSYIDDAFEDLVKQVTPALSNIQSLTASSSNVDILQAFVALWQIIFDFFCGEGSLMDYLGYPIMRHYDVEAFMVLGLDNLGSKASASELPLQPGDIVGESRFDALIQRSNGTALIHNQNMNEYALRAMYAIWFEYYRVNELEPRSANLWEYHDFGSTSLFATATLQKAIATLLPLRIKPWTKDPFTTAQIDDISRHVFAPIVSNRPTAGARYETPSMPAQADLDTNSLADTARGNLWSEILISYVEPTTGQKSNISCPIPSGLSKMTTGLTSQTVSPYVLDMFALSKAKMLERYLKRNLAFGDEYRDRMKAHYDVTIEDYRINRPAYLSGSFKQVAISEREASAGAEVGDTSGNSSPLGTRYVVGAADNNGVADGFEFFASEFGIVITIMSIVPRAQYNHTCPQNFLLKTTDFPSPEFAMQQEDLMNTQEITRQGVIDAAYFGWSFGHVPYAHGYRYRVDDVHGQMLSSKFDYTFARFYEGYTADGVPKLNYKFVHCRPNIPMFVNQILLDGQFYGTIKHNFLVERLLPQPVETI